MSEGVSKLLSYFYNTTKLFYLSLMPWQLKTPGGSHMGLRNALGVHFLTVGSLQNEANIMLPRIYKGRIDGDSYYTM